MGQERTYFEALRTFLLSIEESAGVSLFTECLQQPNLDLNTLLQIPAVDYPSRMCVIIDKGWGLSAANGVVKSGSFDLVIIERSLADHVGSDAIYNIMDLTDIVIDAFNYDTSMAKFTAPVGAVDTIQVQEGVIWAARTLTFAYSYQVDLNVWSTP